MKDRMIEMVVAMLEEVADEQEIELPSDVGPSTPLFGDEGLLDSLGLVNLVVGLEQEIQDELGKSVSLADEKALSAKSSPFRDVDSLASYALQVIEGTN